MGRTLAFKRARRRRNEQIKLGVIVLLSGVIVSRLLWPVFNTHQVPPLAQPTVAAGVYYPDCDAARAAGAAPILLGQPGYRPELDSDADGIACEPYFGRR